MKNKIILLALKQNKIILVGFIIGLILAALYFAFMYTPSYKTSMNLYINLV